jgi:hypothetical protein
VRVGAKGAGEFRRASWDEALDLAAAGLRAAADAHGGESILPYSYMGTQGALQGGSIAHRLMHARRRARPAALLRPARRGRRRGAGRALPARARDAEDAPLPQLDVRQPETPARRAAGAVRGGGARRRRRARDRRRPARARLQRPWELCGHGAVSDAARPGVLVAPMGWWSGDYQDGRSSQVTTSQRLTELGAAPTFNDNRVELEAA